MTTINWDVVMEKALLDILGPPLQETDAHWFWAGKNTKRGDQSRSLKYERQGKWAGCFKDWSTGVGGRVYKFLLYWCDMEKDQATAYLREKGWLPPKIERSDTAFHPEMGTVRLVIENPVTREAEMPPPYDRTAVAFYDAIADRPEALQAAFDACFDQWRKEDIQREWTDAPDPMFDALERLCRDDPTDDNYRALQVHTAARSYCMDHLIAAGVFPPEEVHHAE